MFVFIQQRAPDGRIITRLLPEEGPLRGRMIPLKEPEVTLGSASDNQIALDWAGVAERHLRFEVSPEQVRLVDLGSPYGTFVNGERIHERVLQHGDKISFLDLPELGQKQQGAKPQAPGATTAGEEIFLAEQQVNPLTDDVRTVLGDPRRRWAASTSSQTRMTDPEAVNRKKFEVLLAIGKALSRPEDIRSKVGRVLELLFDTMKIDRAAILVRGEEKEGFEFTSYRDRTGPTGPMDLSSTVINKVMNEGVAVLTRDAQNEQWLDGAQSILGQAIRTCICTPLKTSTGVLGVLYADSTRASRGFSSNDLEFFTAFSNQAAIAIDNARLLQMALEKERIEQDLRVARRIQRWLFPREIPGIPGYLLAGDSIAMDQVGGDYFDYSLVDPDHLALVVGDVSGHGISSALVMTMTRSVLRGAFSIRRSPAETLQIVNRLVSEDMLTRMFVTMLLMVFNIRTGAYVFSSAGHNPLLHYQAATGENLSLRPGGGPLGMSRWARIKPKYKDLSGQMQPGDVLFLYTDGLPEAQNAQEEQLGMEPLEITLRQKAHLPADALLKELFQCVHDFRQDTPLTDDTTAIVLKREPA